MYLPRAVNKLLENNICSILPAVGESPTLFQQGGSNKNFSQEGRFYLVKRTRGWKKAHDRPHTAQEERQFPRKSRNDNSRINVYNIYYIYSYIILYSILCLPGGNVLRTDISKNSCHWLLSTFCHSDNNVSVVYHLSMHLYPRPLTVNFLTGIR